MDFQLRINEDLTLKIRNETHAEEGFALVEKNRKILRKWLPWVDATRSVEDTKRYIIECREKFEKKETADFGVFYQSKLIGSMGFNKLDFQNECAEIGYWLDEDHQGKGIMTKCVQTMLVHGFGTLNLHRIQIRCAALNQKSKAIPERLGFVLEGVVRENHKIENSFSDGLIFGLLKEEFDALNHK